MSKVMEDLSPILKKQIEEIRKIEGTEEILLTLRQEAEGQPSAIITIRLMMSGIKYEQIRSEMNNVSHLEDKKNIAATMLTLILEIDTLCDVLDSRNEKKEGL